MLSARFGQNQHNFYPTPCATFIFITQQLPHYYDNLIDGDSNNGQGNKKGSSKGKGKAGKAKYTDNSDEPSPWGPIAAEDLTMQYSTTALAFDIIVVSIARISNDWYSVTLRLANRLDSDTPLPYHMGLRNLD